MGPVLRHFQVAAKRYCVFSGSSSLQSQGLDCFEDVRLWALWSISPLSSLFLGLDRNVSSGSPTDSRIQTSIGYNFYTFEFKPLCGLTYCCSSLRGKLCFQILDLTSNNRSGYPLRLAGLGVGSGNTPAWVRKHPGGRKTAQFLLVVTRWVFLCLDGAPVCLPGRRQYPGYKGNNSRLRKDSFA